MKLKIFFANFQILGPLGCQGWVAIPQNVKKSQNHCTLPCGYLLKFFKFLVHEFHLYSQVYSQAARTYSYIAIFQPFKLTSLKNSPPNTPLLVPAWMFNNEAYHTLYNYITFIHHLKGSNHEIFEHVVFTQIKLVRVGHLGTRPKI